MRTSIAGASLGTVAGILGLVLWSSAGDTADPDGRDGRLAAMEQQLAHLDREVRELRAESGVLRARLEDEAAIAVAPRTGTPPTRSEPAARRAASPPSPTELNAARERSAREMRERERALDDGFEREPRDGPWALHLEARLAEALAGIDGVAALATECRTTTCRIELREIPGGPPSELALLQSIPDLASAAVEARRDTGGGEEGAVTLFVAPDGALPF